MPYLGGLQLRSWSAISGLSGHQNTISDRIGLISNPTGGLRNYGGDNRKPTGATGDNRGLRGATGDNRGLQGDNRGYRKQQGANNGK